MYASGPVVRVDCHFLLRDAGRCSELCCTRGIVCAIRGIGWWNGKVYTGTVDGDSMSGTMSGRPWLSASTPLPLVVIFR